MMVPTLCPQDQALIRARVGQPGCPTLATAAVHTEQGSLPQTEPSQVCLPSSNLRQLVDLACSPSPSPVSATIKHWPFLLLGSVPLSRVPSPELCCHFELGLL